MLNRLTERWHRFLDLREKGPEAIFTRIYKRNRWGSEESISGPGSSRAQAASFIPDLLKLLASLDASVLLDAPCGDMNWIGEVADSVDEYIGVDIVRELIDRNVALHSGPGRRLLHADLISYSLPRADVVLCRDALVHFSNDDVWSAVRNFKRSGSGFLLTTTFIDRATNKSIPTGSWRPLNLEAPPFCFVPPTALIDEHCYHTDSIYRDKRLALWDLASLPGGPMKDKESRN